MAKHTPGPWIFYADMPSTEPNWHIVTTANRMRTLANVHIEPGNEVDAANACLIAAAPDLAAALRGFVAAMSSPSHERAAELRAALMVAQNAIARSEAA